MCGINGLVFLKGVNRTEEMMKQIRFVFNELMVETQERGEHATGLAHFMRDGAYEWYKAPTNADEMATSDKEYLSIVDNFNGDNTSVVVAHTRYYTKGLPKNNNNNHPFDVGNIIGVHNGSVKNDDELFKKFAFNRVGEVDSEIIFHLINMFNEEKITYKGLERALEDTKIKGLFALAFVNKNETNLVHIVKQEKPMSIAYWKEAGIVIFNSIDTFIEKAFRKLERVSKSLGWNCGELTVEYSTPKDDVYFSIDANAETLESAMSLPQFICLESSSTKYYYDKNKYGSTSYSTTSTSSSTRAVSAKDNLGKTIYGQLDEKTGEVTIFTEEMMDDMVDSYLNSDDGSMEGENSEIACCECYTVLDELELEAKWNDDQDEHTHVCTSCYYEAINYYGEYEEEIEVKVR
jgi:amidophosphoribosyltransferase